MPPPPGPGIRNRGRKFASPAADQHSLRSRDHHCLECVSVDDHRVGVGEPLPTHRFARPRLPWTVNLFGPVRSISIDLTCPRMRTSTFISRTSPRAPGTTAVQKRVEGGLIIHVREFARFVRAWPSSRHRETGSRRIGRARVARLAGLARCHSAAAIMTASISRSPPEVPWA